MGFHYTDAVFNIRVTELEAEEDGEKAILPYTGIDHAVLNALANRANNDSGKCWPGYGLLAEDTHFSRRAVIRAVAKFEKAGLITCELTAERSTNTYTLHMDKLVAVSNLAPAKKKSKRRKLNGKTYTRKEPELYPPDPACDICGNSPTACGCFYPCEQEGCEEISGGLAAHLHHSYVCHQLKVQPVGRGQSMRLSPIAESAKAVGLIEGDDDEPKTISANFEDEDELS